MEGNGPGDEDEGADIPERVFEALDPRSIKQADLDADDYDGLIPISEYLRDNARKKK